MLEQEVFFESDYVEVTFDESIVTVDEIMDELEGIGYRPSSYRDIEDDS